MKWLEKAKSTVETPLIPTPKAIIDIVHNDDLFHTVVEQVSDLHKMVTDVEEDAQGFDVYSQKEVIQNLGKEFLKFAHHVETLTEKVNVLIQGVEQMKMIQPVLPTLIGIPNDPSCKVCNMTVYEGTMCGHNKEDCPFGLG